jgi:hypothetical protein
MAGTQEPAEEGDPSAGSCAAWRCLTPPPTHGCRSQPSLPQKNDYSLASRLVLFGYGLGISRGQEQKNALPSTCLFGPSNRNGCLFRVGCSRARAAGLLRSTDGHCGGARRDCRREAMQWAVGLPVCPLATSGLMRCSKIYSITSSASCRRCNGTSRPNAFAVLRLITSSNFVGCSIGISAGLTPRKSCTSCRATSSR